VRAALFDDQHIVLGWYTYELLRTPTEGYPNDKVSVWGHDGRGLIMVIRIRNLNLLAIS